MVVVVVRDHDEIDRGQILEGHARRHQTRWTGELDRAIWYVNHPTISVYLPQHPDPAGTDLVYYFPAAGRCVRAGLSVAL